MNCWLTVHNSNPGASTELPLTIRNTCMQHKCYHLLIRMYHYQETVTEDDEIQLQDTLLVSIEDLLNYCLDRKKGNMRCSSIVQVPTV